MKTPEKDIFLENWEDVRRFELQLDLDYLNSKGRELNSFEKGIKEEIERLLNDPRKD